MCALHNTSMPNAALLGNESCAQPLPKSCNDANSEALTQVTHSADEPSLSIWLYTETRAAGAASCGNQPQSTTC